MNKNSQCTSNHALTLWTFCPFVIINFGTSKTAVRMILKSYESSQSDYDKDQRQMSANSHSAQSCRSIWKSINAIVNTQPRLPRVIPTTRIGQIVHRLTQLSQHHIIVFFQVEIKLVHPLPWKKKSLILRNFQSQKKPKYQTGYYLPKCLKLDSRPCLYFLVPKK